MSAQGTRVLWSHYRKGSDKLEKTYIIKSNKRQKGKSLTRWTDQIQTVGRLTVHISHTAANPHQRREIISTKCYRKGSSKNPTSNWVIESDARKRKNILLSFLFFKLITFCICIFRIVPLIIFWVKSEFKVQSVVGFVS